MVFFGPWDGVGGLYFRQSSLNHVYKAVLCELTMGWFFVTLDSSATVDSPLSSLSDLRQILSKILFTASPKPSTGLFP